MSTNPHNPAEDLIRVDDDGLEMVVTVSRTGPGEAYADAIAEFVRVIRDNEGEVPDRGGSTDA